MFVKWFNDLTGKKPVDTSWVETETERLRVDLETKRKAAIERMGNKWILHPDHMVKNKSLPPNTLGSKSV
jgi:hypothetical protein